MASLLDAESLIIARLQQRVDAADWTGSVKPIVQSEAELAGVEEQSQVAPAIQVLLNGYQPVDERGEGKITLFELDWLIVVAVRSGYEVRSGEGLRIEATPMMDLVLAALLGWKPSADFSHMKAAPAPGPAYTDAGFGYFPLMFKTRATVRGT